MALVYKVTSPSNKVYVGITSQYFEQRKREHKCNAFSRNRTTPFYNALRKYKELMIWEILEESLEFKEALSREIFYINFFKSNDKKYGYNCTSGGEGTMGFKLSKETRLKISLKNKNRIIKDSTRLKLSKIKKGIKFSKEFGTKVAIGHGAKEFEVRNISSNEIVGIWINKAHCSLELGLKRRKIQDCLQNKRKSTGGYTFCYLGVNYRTGS